MKLRPFLLACALFSCAKNDPQPAPATQKEFPSAKVAPAQVEDSLKPISGTKGSSITIRKSSLGKVFMLTMTLSEAGTTSDVQMLMPKAVTFELNGSEVGLIEQNVRSVYEEIPSAKILQSFAVESQDDESVTFQWKYGLSSLPTLPFYVSPLNAASVAEMVNDAEQTLPVTASYTKFARIQDNRLEIRQLMRVRSPSSGSSDDGEDVTREEGKQLDIAIAPYVPNPRFKLLPSTRLKGVGFFDVVQVRKNDGGPVDLFSSHWDLSPEAGLITYALSKNTPPEAIEAMRNGLNYWNEVAKATIGREILKVETGADPASPPRPRTVMVFWVPNANAGSAHAGFQTDPLTGEITSGLIFQTTVFSIGARERGIRLVNRGVENAPGSRTAVVASSFRSAELCRMKQPQWLGLDPVASELPNDEKVGQRMAETYLGFVLAHEAGHTLGLRHNFAGTLSSELPDAATAREKFRDFLTNEHTEGAVISSSIMDYPTFRDRMLLAAAIKAKKTFAYDRAAFAWAYGGKSLAELNAPYYCADEEAGNKKFLGCDSTDTGAHPVAGFAAEFGRTRLLSPDVIVEAITDAIRPSNPRDAKTVRQALAANHPDKISSAITSELNSVPLAGGPGVKAVAVDQALQGANWTNGSEYAAQTRDYIAKEFEVAGGLPGILKTGLNLDENFHLKRGWLLAGVHERLDKPTFGSGKSPNGKPYQLSPEEIRDAKAAVEKLAAAVETATLRDSILALTGIPPKSISEEAGKGTLSDYVLYPESIKSYGPALPVEDWQTGIDAFAAQLINEADGEVEGTVGGKPVKLPRAAFPIEVRVVATRFYSPRVFSRKEDWMKDQTEKLEQALLARVAPVLDIPGGDVNKAKPAGEPSKEVVEWLRGELTVLKALQAARD